MLFCKNITTMKENAVTPSKNLHNTRNMDVLDFSKFNMDLISQNLLKLSVLGPVVITTCVSVAIYKYFTRKRHFEHPKETVVIVKFGTNPSNLCLSPFTTKLETFLRLANIPYKTSTRQEFSSKRKKPWILHNNQKIADSQFCIEYLKREFGVNLNAKLSEKQKAVAHAMRRMVEENTYWCLILERWVYKNDPNVLRELGIPWIWLPYVTRFVKKQTYAHGMGRHSPEEVLHILKQDVDALAAQLGDKSYMFGEEPIEEDCSIFAVVFFLIYSIPNSLGAQYVQANHSNLVSYVNRMRDQYWSDWCKKDWSKK